jgi:hypothetical protein
LRERQDGGVGDEPRGSKHAARAQGREPAARAGR